LAVADWCRLHDRAPHGGFCLIWKGTGRERFFADVDLSRAIGVHLRFTAAAYPARSISTKPWRAPSLGRALKPSKEHR